jgi:hypothetical protein
MSRCNDNNRKQLMDFVLKAPFDESVIDMDCKDGCEQISHLADRVARGEKLEDLLPEYEEHIQYWHDCREEFDALVAIIRAEQAGQLPDVAIFEPADPLSGQQNKDNDQRSEPPPSAAQ